MRRLVRPAFELFLLPGLGAVLPWSWCYRVFRLASRLPLYQERSLAALEAARRLQPIENPGRWVREHRLVRLCDHADLFISRTRSDGWMARHVRVEGEWPAGEPFLAVTFHWGAGHWALRHMRSRGVKGALLSKRFDLAAFGGDWVSHAYARQRMRDVRRVSGTDVIYMRETRRSPQARRRSFPTRSKRWWPSQGAAAAMRAAWGRGDSVVALYDVPPHLVSASVDARVFGHPIRLPMGIARLACEERIPVVAFSMGIDPKDGSRILEIRPLWRGTNEADLVAHLATEFERLLRRDLAAWQLCADAAAFFPDLMGEPASP